MRFDPMLQLVENRAQTQIIFEVFEGRLYLRQLDVKLPQFGQTRALSAIRSLSCLTPSVRLHEIIFAAQIRQRSALACDLDQIAVTPDHHE